MFTRWLQWNFSRQDARELKSEFRSSKSETNRNTQIQKSKSKTRVFGILCFLIIRICFEFRISSFEFVILLILGALCAFAGMIFFRSEIKIERKINRGRIRHGARIRMQDDPKNQNPPGCAPRQRWEKPWEGNLVGKDPFPARGWSIGPLNDSVTS